MTSKRFAHVLEVVQERPWAILPSTLVTIRAIMAEHRAGVVIGEDEMAERIASAQAQLGDRTGSSMAAGVAIIPLYGVIVPKAGLMTDVSGATSVQAFLKAFRLAMADPEVKAIVFDVDSPGGQTDLIPEAAAEIRAARGKKPMAAVADTLMASAAYWLASQADEVIASPSAWVGSIGVYTYHEDLSGALALEGIGKEYVSAGKFKTEVTELGPLEDAARAHIQALVDEDYGRFVGDVAKARGVSPQAVRDGMGQGRILSSSMALAQGLVDRVDTLEATVKRMVWLAARKPADQAARAYTEAMDRVRSALAASPEELARVRAGFAALLGETDGEPTPAEPLEPISPEPDGEPLEPLTPEEPEAATVPDPRFAFERELLERRRRPATV